MSAESNLNRSTKIASVKKKNSEEIVRNDDKCIPFMFCTFRSDHFEFL